MEFHSFVPKTARFSEINIELKQFLSHITLGRLKKKSKISLDSYFRNIFLVGSARKVSIFESIIIPNGFI